MENLLVVTHDVADVAAWKTGFDSQEEMRASVGVKTLGVYQSDENPNRITVITQLSDVAAAKEMLNSPDLKEGMEKAGVTSAPVISFLNQVN